jgi:hypothetical protein
LLTAPYKHIAPNGAQAINMAQRSTERSLPMGHSSLDLVVL